MQCQRRARDAAGVQPLDDLDKSPLMFDGLVQGVINHIALTEIARGPMAQQLFVDDNGTSIVDPDKIYDYGLGGTIPPTNEPPPDNGVHGRVSTERAHLEMMRIFAETGVITQTCSAPNGCDCTADGCGSAPPSL